MEERVNVGLKRGIWIFLALLFTAKFFIGGTLGFPADRDGKSMKMKKLFPLKIGSYLIRYASQTLAKEGVQSFVKAYMPEPSSSKAIRTEDERWTTAQVYKNYDMVVFDSPSKEKAETLMQNT
jgi:hypothetical protein